MTDSTLDDLVARLRALNADERALAGHFIDFLAWQRRQRSDGGIADPGLWREDLLDLFSPQSVSASTGDAAGLEAHLGMAIADGVERAALFAHPPVRGECVIALRVAIPAGLRDPRLRVGFGLRDGAGIADDNLVAFRIRVNGYRVWSAHTNARRWEDIDLALPVEAGNMAAIELRTEALGNHRYTWAAWAQPRVLGTHQV
ncbi:MAG: hypothetical protein K1X39_05100 [Thermoflexales bacterium]|nr:hypothetical protein [Thermoflexales bacterium]